MNCSYQFEHSEYGIINVFETTKARRLTLRILSNGSIRVSVPPSLDLRYISNFIRKNGEKIKAIRAEITEKHKGNSRIIFNPNCQFSTISHKLTFELNDNITSEKIYVKQGLITLVYQSKTNFATDNIQCLIRKGIDFALKIESQKFITPRVSQFAKEMGLSYSKLSFRNMTSRWGSCCKAKGYITLNVQMMRLPQHLIDFLIIHELCHLIEANHGHHFHELVNNYCNGCESLFEKEIKNYHCEY